MTALSPSVGSPPLAAGAGSSRHRRSARAFLGAVAFVLVLIVGVHVSRPETARAFVPPPVTVAAVGGLGTAGAVGVMLSPAGIIIGGAALAVGIGWATWQVTTIALDKWDESHMSWENSRPSEPWSVPHDSTVFTLRANGFGNLYRTFVQSGNVIMDVHEEQGISSRRCIYEGGGIVHLPGDNEQVQAGRIGFSCALVNPETKKPLATMRVSDSVVTILEWEHLPRITEYEYTCQDSNGDFLTYGGRITYQPNIMNTTTIGALPQTQCYGDSHYTAKSFIFYGLDFEGNLFEIDRSIWEAKPEFTDPNSRFARCGALAGRTPCTVQPRYEGEDPTEDWSHIDPGTGIRRPPSGVEERPIGCRWGTIELTPRECFGDGAAPAPQPTPVPSPSPSPSTPVVPDPGPSPSPEPTASPEPSPSPEPEPLPEPPPGSQECWPSGWSVFNPFEWVLMPVQCALDWAFVPRTDIGPQVSSAMGQYMTLPPLSWPGEMHGIMFSGVPRGSGACPDWSIEIAGERRNVVCDSSFTSALVNLRPVLLGMMVLVGFSPLLRSLFYAAIPIVRPVPTR